MAQIFVNPNCNMAFWTDELRNWCLQVGDSFNGIGVDHYPGTWAYNGWLDWFPLDLVINITNDKSHPCFGKTPALMETGYSSFSDFLGHDENSQSLWVNQSLVKAVEFVKNSQQQQFSVGNIAFYELYDEGDPSTTFPPEEAHFGLVRNNGTKKAAFFALKKFVEDLKKN